MLAKLTSKNQITLPKAVMSKFPDAEYFDVQEIKGEIVLKPVSMRNLEPVWRKIEALGITEKDIADAVTWARKKPAKAK